MRIGWATSILAGGAGAALAAPPPTITGVAIAGGAITAHVLIAADAGGAPALPPPRLEGTVRSGGRVDPAVLVRVQAAVPPVAPGGWAVIDYATRWAGDAGGPVTLSLGDGGQGFAVAAPAGDTAVAARDGAPAATAAAEPAPPAAAATTPARDEGARPGNIFLANLSTYQPIYATLGHGTDTDARLQISFKYQLFGSPGDGRWWDGFHFAYTQKMFWDTGASSAPFRDVDYQPEFLYIYRHAPSGDGLRWGAQGGFLHQSNGRDGAASRAYNIVYAQPQATIPLGGWDLSVAPRVWIYVAGRDGNEDIARYRGHQSLAVSIGRADGLKLSATERFGFGSGKGAVEGELSYPLNRFWKPLPLYIMVQGFTGYGEDLLDYDRKQTRLRVGLGIVR